MHGWRAASRRQPRDQLAPRGARRWRGSGSRPAGGSRGPRRRRRGCRRRSRRGCRCGQSITSARATIAPSGRPLAIPLARQTMSPCDAPVLRGEHPAGPADARLDLVEHEQDPVLVAEPSEAGQEVGGRHDVSPFALDRLDEDRRQLVGGADGPQQGADALEVAVAGVVDLRDERARTRGAASASSRSATWRRRSGRGTRRRNAIARGRPVCRRASFSAASIASAPLLVKKTRFGPGPGASRGQPLGQPDLRRVIEVGPRHVDQPARLLADRRDDPRVAVARPPSRRSRR